jgi:hypothetical protein
VTYSIFGEGAIELGKPRKDRAVALMNSQLLVLNIEDFRSIQTVNIYFCQDIESWTSITSRQ